MRFRAALLLLMLWAVAGPTHAAVYKVHVVQRGDTLSSVARTHGCTVAALAQSNKIEPAATLKIGQRLYLPIQSRENPVAPEADRPPPTTPIPLGVPITRPVTRAIPRTTPVPRAERTPATFTAPRGIPVEEEEPRTAAASGSSSFIRGMMDRAARKSAGDFRFVSRVKRQIDAPLYKARAWRNIVMHHSGSRAGSAAVFNAYHRRRGMSNGLAYHFVIGNGTDSGDGEIEVGDRWKAQIHGGHVHSDTLNKISIGICLVGNFNETRPTSRQIAATVELIEYLRYLQGKGYPLKFWVHRQINPRPTECPGAKFPTEAMKRLLN